MQDSGVHTPALENRPTLASRWKYPMEVYSRLSGSRRYTMVGAAPIPISEFESIARLLGLKGWHCIEVLDDVVQIDRTTLAAHAKMKEASKGTKK